MTLLIEFIDSTFKYVLTLYTKLLLSDDYRAHTSCVTEVERYEKRAPKKNGKVPPQQLWMDLIAASIPMAPTHLLSYIRTMSSLDNVPRKEKPFYNFTANSLNLKNKHGSGIVSEIWKYLSDCRRNQVSETKRTNGFGESAEVVQSATVDPLSKSGTKTAAPRVDTETNVKESSEIFSKETLKCDPIEALSVTVDKKLVKKKMKQAFKRSNSKSLTLKALRKLIKGQFNKDEQGTVKQLMMKSIGQGKHFSQEGDMITLLK